MFCSFIFFLGFFVLLVFFCKKEMIFIKLTNNVKKKKVNLIHLPLSLINQALQISFHLLVIIYLQLLLRPFHRTEF